MLLLLPLLPVLPLLLPFLNKTFVCENRYVVALKVPKFSGYKPGIFYDTAEPQHTALLTGGKQSGRDGYHDLLLVAGEAHDQVGCACLEGLA